MDKLGGLQKLVKQLDEIERLEKFARPIRAYQEAVGQIDASQLAILDQIKRSGITALARQEAYAVSIVRGELANAGWSGNESATAQFDIVREKSLIDYFGRFQKAGWDVDIAEKAKLATEQISWLDHRQNELVMKAFQYAVETRQRPWINHEDAAGSVRGLVELMALGETMQRYGAFHNKSNLAIQATLGDWSAVRSLPPDLYADAVARSRFYMEHGYDSALADYPRPALLENLELAGFQIYSSPALHTPSNRETDLASEASDLIDQFEKELRAFITKKLSALAGSKWVKQRVHGDVHTNWKGRKQIDIEKRGVDLPLIEYCDFAEYPGIFTKEDNWKSTFEPHFKNKQLVETSFMRMSAPRNAAKHARKVTEDDCVFLAVEIRYLRKAMQEPMPSVPSDDWE